MQAFAEPGTKGNEECVSRQNPQQSHNQDTLEHHWCVSCPEGVLVMFGSEVPGRTTSVTPYQQPVMIGK